MGPNLGRHGSVLRVEHLDPGQARRAAALRERECFDRAGVVAVKNDLDRDGVQLERSVGLGGGGNACLAAGLEVQRPAFERDLEVIRGAGEAGVTPDVRFEILGGLSRCRRARCRKKQDDELTVVLVGLMPVSSRCATETRGPVVGHASGWWPGVAWRR